ncbi:phage tail protein [Roseospira visakhapatnamensis]|uniref:Phage-related tail fiber protein n=1 Tax=Roseospira visakhapatnamensis TaxID=390880 RepID=A0A7W6RGC7_9PROT|nr:phage tail protein [Roseospira visakhapatnamensis]MBB4267358.1 phage-related tail fiber protein [Roseospira visakhapatnamensis]
MPDYYTILTVAGQAKIANALALGTTIALDRMAVGDGGGVAITPTETMTALAGETYRGAIERLTADPDNPSWVIAELVIPPDVGGWSVRELGLFDAAGDLIAVANLPETYKPVLAEGSARDMILRMVLEVSDTAAVTLTLDPTVTLASRAWVLSVLPAVIQATTEVRGVVELATVAETQAGADANRAVTPAGLYNTLALVLPVGTILWSGAALPSAGWLVCDGAAVSRTEYGDLFAVLGTTWGAGDGSTTFQVPDLRGEFVRGIDLGRGIDSGRTPGSWQCASHLPHDTDGQHIHSIPDSEAAIDAGLEAPTLEYLTQIWVDSGLKIPPGARDDAPAFYSSTVRPRNVALLPIIRY